MRGVMRKFQDFCGNKLGATAIEYGLIASIISLVLFSALGPAGLNIGPKFDAIFGPIIAALSI